VEVGEARYVAKFAPVIGELNATHAVGVLPVYHW